MIAKLEGYGFIEINDGTNGHAAIARCTPAAISLRESEGRDGGNQVT